MRLENEFIDPGTGGGQKAVLMKQLPFDLHLLWGAKLSPEFFWHFQTLDFLTLTDVLVQDFVNVLGCYFVIPDAVRIDDDDRTHRTRPHA